MNPGFHHQKDLLKCEKVQSVPLLKTEPSRLKEKIPSRTHIARHISHPGADKTCCSHDFKTTPLNEGKWRELSARSSARTGVQTYPPSGTRSHFCQGHWTCPSNTGLQVFIIPPYGSVLFKLFVAARGNALTSSGAGGIRVRPPSFLQLV